MENVNVIEKEAVVNEFMLTLALVERINTHMILLLSNISQWNIR